MRRQWNNIISVVHSWIRFGCLKMYRGSHVHVGLIERFSPNVVFEVNRGAKVRLGKKVSAHSGSKFKVRKGGELIVEDGVKINYNCIVVCREKISIGEGTEIGPSVYFYDHDHDYRAGLKNNQFRTAPITIGKNCWIGANAVILRGTTLGDDCVVGAGCILRGGVFPDHSVIVQTRETRTQTYTTDG